MKPNFESCYIFGKGEVYDQLGSLKLISAQQNPFPIILTTAKASLGHDLT